MMQSRYLRPPGVVLMLVIFSCSVLSQVDVLLPEGTTYDPAIPTPEAFFGFRVGDWHLQPDQIGAYLLLLAERSDRVTIEEYGRTHENRPLLLLTITSPANHRNIQKIKERHVRSLDPDGQVATGDDKLPVVVWLGYSIHGNESSGSNAAPLVAYYLASAQGGRVDQWLSDMVILLDPMINPDGLNRFAHWANMHKGKELVADPLSREHREAWPGGRTNHYWFDLNRDWLPVQHPETVGRLAKYYEWRPTVLTDHHEMDTDATFFFQPGVPSRTNPLTPPRNVELTDRLARFHARAMDRAGALYFTRERFDDFYIGKGSSYPDITGCVGILFEQASARGHLHESENGVLRFPFTIRNQILTSLSTLEGAHELRGELLAYQRDFYRSALREAGRDPVQAYVLSGGADGARLYHFVELLRRHQIEVHQLREEIRVAGQKFSPGSAILVPTRQRQYRLIEALFEKRTDFQDSIFYDVSAWTLPLAFGLNYAGLSSVPGNLQGTVVDSPVFPRWNLEVEGPPYAYALEWSGYYAPRALNRILKAGLHARIATKPFSAEVGGKRVRFDYGSVVIPMSLQSIAPDSVRRVMEAIGRADGLPVYGLSTGMSADGVDLGSSSLRPVSLPSVMIVVGAGVSPTGVGEIWYLLDKRFGMVVSLVEHSLLKRADLSRYSVIIMVDGDYSAVDSTSREALKGWIQKGGTLIALEDALRWVISNNLAKATIRKLHSGKDSTGERRPYEIAPQYAAARRITGAICRVSADRTHPLLFGYQDSVLSIFRAANVFLEPSGNSYATPLMHQHDPLVSGYINKEPLEQLKKSASITVTGLGSGRAILIADNPCFRGFWYGTDRILLNGIFLGEIIGPATMERE
ncbi:MAG: M14 family metallopeptidase [Ignavibacteria bacterium]|nr:M14 family metallopeptidase [Ignavibacteria bacterium]